jgi:hypothetical protein
VKAVRNDQPAADITSAAFNFPTSHPVFTNTMLERSDEMTENQRSIAGIDYISLNGCRIHSTGVQYRRKEE